MKTTTALASRLRQFLVNLHPPSPPTAQEGKELLKIIQSSFKRQLDAQHPNPQNVAAPYNRDLSTSIPLYRESISTHATNSHMSSILVHPILGSLENLHTRDDIVARFEKLVAESRLDIPRLLTLMQWYNKSTTNGRSVDSFGDKLNVWVLSTSESLQTEFFTNVKALDSAIRTLAPQSKESILWTWLRTIYERDSLNTTLRSSKWLYAEDKLVASLVRVALHDGDVDEATQQYIEACDYRYKSGRQDRVKADTSSTMSQSGMSLASFVLLRRKNHGITPDLFAKALPFLPSWSRHSDTSAELCAVYDPTTPTADLLYSKLSRNAEVLIGRQKKASRTSRSAVMTALLDASLLSLDQGKKSQAAFLLNFAVDHYPDFLPKRQQEHLDSQLDLRRNIAQGLKDIRFVPNHAATPG